LGKEQVLPHFPLYGKREGVRASAGSVLEKAAYQLLVSLWTFWHWLVEKLKS